MRELLYSACVLAAIISRMELEDQAESSVINAILEGEKDFLEEQYYEDSDKFKSAIRNWLSFWKDKPEVEEEFPDILQYLNLDDEEDEEQYTSEFPNLDWFLKESRIRILYGGGDPYVKVTLRSLIGMCGYKRSSENVVTYIDRHMFFYHFEATLQDGEVCYIEDAGLDDMLTFRVV